MYRFSACHPGSLGPAFFLLQLSAALSDRFTSQTGSPLRQVHLSDRYTSQTGTPLRQVHLSYVTHSQTGTPKYPKPFGSDRQPAWLVQAVARAASSRSDLAAQLAATSAMHGAQALPGMGDSCPPGSSALQQGGASRRDASQAAIHAEFGGGAEGDGLASGGGVAGMEKKEGEEEEFIDLECQIWEVRQDLGSETGFC